MYVRCVRVRLDCALRAAVLRVASVRAALRCADLGCACNLVSTLPSRRPDVLRQSILSILRASNV